MRYSFSKSERQRKKEKNSKRYTNIHKFYRSGVMLTEGKKSYIGTYYRSGKHFVQLDSIYSNLIR